jgi:hypothetical protein
VYAFEESGKNWEVRISPKRGADGKLTWGVEQRQTGANGITEFLTTNSTLAAHPHATTWVPIRWEKAGAVKGAEVSGNAIRAGPDGLGAAEGAAGATAASPAKPTIRDGEWVTVTKEPTALKPSEAASAPGDAPSLTGRDGRVAGGELPPMKVPGTLPDDPPMTPKSGPIMKNPKPPVKPKDGAGGPETALGHDGVDATKPTTETFNPAASEHQAGAVKPVEGANATSGNRVGPKPANFESFGIRDAKSGQPVTWEGARQTVIPKENEAFFWSGRTNGVGGEGASLEIARSKGGTTLEGLIKSEGIEMPGRDHPMNKAAWDEVSRLYAENASGTVRVVLGQEVREGSVWKRIEFDTLKANPKVNEIIAIDPLTLEEKSLFRRGDFNQ